MNGNYDSQFNDQVFKKFKGLSIRNDKKRRHMSASNDRRLLFNHSSGSNLVQQINNLSNNSVSIGAEKLKSMNI